jgi:hypothetical protein
VNETRNSGHSEVISDSEREDIKIEAVFELRIAIATAIHKSLSPFSNQDRERVFFLLSDWYFPQTCRNQVSLEEYLVINLVEDNLASKVRSCASVITAQLEHKWNSFTHFFQLTESQAKMGWSALIEEPSDLESVFLALGIKYITEEGQSFTRSNSQGWKMRATILRYLKLPPNLRNRISILPSNYSLKEISIYSAKALVAEQAFILMRKGTDVFITLPLFMDRQLTAHLQSLGVLALAPTILAILSSEIIMYHAQKMAATQAKQTSRVISTVALLGLRMSPSHAALTQRILGKFGKIEYGALFPIAILNGGTIFSTIVIYELITAATVLPDATANYLLAAMAGHKKKPRVKKSERY